MKDIKTINIIDRKESRRGRISFLLNSLNYYTKIHDAVDNFESSFDSNSIIFLYNDMNSVALKRLISKNDHAGNWYPVVLYDEKPTAETITSAIFAGALDFIIYPFAVDDVTRCIERVVRRSAPVEEARRVRAIARGWVSKLSPRERDVLSGVVGGMTSKEIATGLGISPRTIDIHRSNLMRKLGTRTVFGAVRLALESSEFRSIPLLGAGESL